jgi:rubrerythrin
MSTAAVKTTPATLSNLQIAFNGESNAHARYLEYAKKADAEGFAGVASLFRAAARAEQIHAANHAVVIRKLGAEPAAKIERPEIRPTRENLMTAIEGETYERDVMYPQFVKVAQQENNTDAIRTFNFALEAETEHARLYAEALANLNLKKPQMKYFVCAICGYTTEKLEGERCPVCSHPREKFEIVS